MNLYDLLHFTLNCSISPFEPSPFRGEFSCQVPTSKLGGRTWQQKKGKNKSKGQTRGFPIQPTIFVTITGKPCVSKQTRQKPRICIIWRNRGDAKRHQEPNEPTRCAHQNTHPLYLFLRENPVNLFWKTSCGFSLVQMGMFSGWGQVLTTCKFRHNVYRFFFNFPRGTQRHQKQIDPMIPARYVLIGYIYVV